MPLTPIRAEQRNSGDTYIFSRVGAGRYCNSLIINASIISAALTLIHMDAGGGRCPFAQVLRNSLSGHPPPTGHDT